MVTRLDDGRKIREFRNGNDSVSDNNPAANNVLDTLDFDIVGDPAVYNTFLGTFVTRLFVGDEGGQLWRIDVSSADPSQWKMSFFFDIYYEHAQAGIDYALRGPIQAAPAMSPVPQRGQLALVFGSGDVDSTSSLSQWAIVYSIKEKLLVDPSSGALLPGSVSYEVNWKRQLNEGEFLSSSPIIYNNTAYFTSFQPDSTDACDGGIGRIWGLDFIQSSTGTTPVGKLDGDGDPTTTGDTVEYIELVDSIPTGLSLISRPACSGNQGVDAATSGGGSSAQGGSSALQASKPGVLELVVQTGSSGQTNSASAPATGNATSQVRKFAQPIPRPSPQVISVSWGQIQNL
jgi:hypothetical protein